MADISKIILPDGSEYNFKDQVSGYIPSPSGASSGEFLKYNGTSWVADVVPGGASPSDTTPSASTASGSAGTAAAYSRGDHAHPKEIFIATYGTTTAAQLSTALLAEKLIVAVRTSTNRLAVLYRGDPIMSQFWFSFIDIYGKAEEWYCDTSGWTRDTTDLVPTTRTVNGNALSSNVTLDADDVGAAPAKLVFDSQTSIASVADMQTQLTTWFSAMPQQSERVFYASFSSSATGTIPFALGTGVIIHIQRGASLGTATFYGRTGNPASTIKISTMTYYNSAWSEFQDVATKADIDAAIGGAIAGSY